MHPELPILVNITVALIAAFIGGMLARRLKLPTIVGYLIAGMAIGPFTPGFIGDMETIQQFAELGVVFMLFGVGLHFSLRDLWAVRGIAIPGAITQMTLTTLLGILLTTLWGWPLVAGIVLGLAISIASTVVLLRNLMDQGLLNTSHGQVAVGWLVLEDLATVLILVLLPTLAANSSDAVWQTTGLALLKAATFAVIMLVAGTRLIPWFLLRVARVESRELFIVAVVVITVGTAIGAAYFFGVSLALGAFLAGVVVSESSLHHQVAAEILPFRETFSVLFFVSVGMLVNPFYIFEHIGEVVALTLVIVVGKFLVTLLLGLLLPRPARTALVVAAGLAQIGEFSFILGQTGVALNLLTQDQYSLILVGALFSITVNPFVFRVMPWIEARLQQWPSFWTLLNRHGKIPPPPEAPLRNHVVVVGYGRVGHHIVKVLARLNIPHIVVDLDIGRITELAQQGVPTLYGDAADSEILSHAYVQHARAIVVTLPNETAAEIVVMTSHKLAPEVPLIVRAATQQGVLHLFELGAREVIHPELEGGLNITRQTLVHLGYPEEDIQGYVDAVRHDHYDTIDETAAEREALEQMSVTHPPAHSMRFQWMPISSQSALVNQTLEEIKLNERIGGVVVAVERDQTVTTNPPASFKLRAGDLLGVAGDLTCLQKAEKVVREQPTSTAI